MSELTSVMANLQPLVFSEFVNVFHSLFSASNRRSMVASLEKLKNEIRSLLPDEFDKFLSWLAQYQAGQMDDWDREIERDSQTGGRLQNILDRVRKDIAAGRTIPLDEFLDNS